MPLPNPFTVCRLTHEFICKNILPVIDWTDLEQAVEYWANRHDGDGPTEAYYNDVFPTLIYTAVGGEFQKSIPLTAFWLLNILAARVFDDIQDRQGENNLWNKRGLDQSLPTGITLLTAANICLSHLHTDIDSFQAILNALGRAGALAAKAQSFSPTNDLSTPSLEQYFSHIIGSTAEVFAAGAWAGGRLRLTDANTLQSLREFGYNMGMRMAILSDCLDLKPESPDKPSDLTVGSYRLPVLYAASLTEHPGHKTLMGLLNQPTLAGERLEQAIVMLEDMGAIAWSVQMAMEFRKRAFAALDSLPGRTKEILASYV